MFECKVCKKSFESKMALCGHSRIHNGKPYIRKKILKLGDSNVDFHICQFCKSSFPTGVSLGGHVSRCSMNPNSAETHRITGLSLKGRKTPEEIKKRIGDSVRRYLTEHPDRVPYLLNHSSKGPSYPERYFKKLFEEENIQLEFMVPVLSYVLDFCDSVRKIDVEIDGEQHYVDKRIVKHDINRNRRLIEDGWRIYRIRWSEYKRLDYDEKHNEIEKLKNFLGA